MRLRPADFEPDDAIIGDSGAQWPYTYDELESFYCRAEQLIGIAGDPGDDPTEPPRSHPYPGRLNHLSKTAEMIRQAASKLGYRPFRLPLAINYQAKNGQAACIACPTCDTFACAIGAKNDLATRVLPALIDKGLVIKADCIALKLTYKNGSVTGVEYHDKTTTRTVTANARVVIVAAGAIASPHLLLASGLEKHNPAGHLVGRYLTRHCNAIAFGFFPRQPGDVTEYHKQMGIHDFYFGHPDIATPPGKLGSMQQLQTPPIGLIHAMLPKPFGRILGLGVPHLTGLLVMAEDQPQYDNRIEVDKSVTDHFGLPEVSITHKYSQRDYAARDALLAKARGILKAAGAWFCYLHHIKTFSHAVGTVRMGTDPDSSALDQWCRFRGVDNLYVTDGSFMPTSGGLNPSLTIAANALRVGGHLVNRVF
jgi:choline dehydrogenase-like flavoprotein